ncbi:MAG: NUDIX domain-containing protein, partial [Clostridia bacterium]|nr:NUDIX domain-containing protein [Clostridia bacterium]
MKTFGEKDPHLTYYTRPGAYLIAVEKDCIILVETPKGYFLPGGGLDADETHEACIHRECLEELGYTVTVREKLAEAEMYTVHPAIGPFHPVQYYYTGTLAEQVTEPAEPDHRMVRIPVEMLDPAHPSYAEQAGKF